MGMFFGDSIFTILTRRLSPSLPCFQMYNSDDNIVLFFSLIYLTTSLTSAVSKKFYTTQMVFTIIYIATAAFWIRIFNPDICQKYKNAT